MNNDNNNTTARLIAGLVLIVLGGLFLLDNYNIINFTIPHIFLQWEYILIAIGIYISVASNKKTLGIILIAVGFLNLLPNFWPLILVGLGINIILRRNKSCNNKEKMSTYSEESGSKINVNKEEESSSKNYFKNYIDDVSIFGGGTKNFISPNFSGGKLTAIFGGSDIHLEGCQLAPKKHELDLFVMFGGYTIYVPKDWNIIIDVVPIFGGFADKRIHDPNKVYEEDKVLIIKGIILFGGGEIKF